MCNAHWQGSVNKHTPALARRMYAGARDVLACMRVMGHMLMPLQTPLLITTTSDAVPAVYATLPTQRRQDAVFTSNGMFLRFFAQETVPDCTQALLYLSGASSQHLCRTLAEAQHTPASAWCITALGGPAA